jgi:spore germination protein YaaH
MHIKRTYCCCLFALLICLIPAVNISAAPQYEDDSIRSAHHYYSSIPEADKHFFRGDSIRPSLSANNTGTYKLKKGIRIFGWHLHWMNNSYRNYNYSLLTHFAYFSCGVDPDNGSITDLLRWDTTSVVSYVKARNPDCKVLLTLTCFGQSNLRSFLTNTAAQGKLINVLYAELLKKKADGVCIDFEGVPADSKKELTLFISNLKKRFAPKNLIVSFTLPAVDAHSSPYDFDALKQQVDLFVLMGYDYFGSFSHDAGPIAPMVTRPNWIPSCIDTSVNYYLNKKIPDSLLLLGVPYYGAMWKTKTASVPSGPVRFYRYRAYSYSLSLPSSVGAVKNNADLKASYYAYPDSQKGDTLNYRQFWVDNVYSLGLKYDYVLQKKLGGVGIWALGFDEGSSNLWNLLRDKFTAGTADTADAPPAGTSFSKMHDVVALLESKPVLSAILAFFLLTTLLIVLVKVISDPANRDKLKQSGLIYLIYISIAALFSVNFYGICMFCFNLTAVASSVALGVLLVALITLRIIKLNRDRQMP